MKNLTTIAFGFIALNAGSVFAGQSSTPVMFHNDQDLQGNPITPHCQDGWVRVTNSSKLCKPFNGQDPDLGTNDEAVNNTNDNTNNNTANSSSSSDSSSVSSASSNSSTSVDNTTNLNSLAITNNNSQYFEFSNGAKLPTSQLNFDYVNSGGVDTVRASVSVPLGVNKMMILKDVERTHQLSEAKFCVEMLQSGVTMSVERMTYFDCDGFMMPEVELVPVPGVPNDYQELKDSMTAYKAELRKAQEFNASLIERIKQLQTPANPAKDNG